MKDPGPREELILAVVSQIPAGTLASYGDVAEVATELGVPCSARQVAGALSRFGSLVPWWRVVQSAGTLARPVAQEAHGHLVSDGIPVQGRRVPLAQCRWVPDPEELSRRIREGGGG